MFVCDGKWMSFSNENKTYCLVNIFFSKVLSLVDDKGNGIFLFSFHVLIAIRLSQYLMKFSASNLSLKGKRKKNKKKNMKRIWKIQNTINWEWVVKMKKNIEENEKKMVWNVMTWWRIFFFLYWRWDKLYKLLRKKKY